ncbi:MAG: orotidine 5'-phosphate decarboxylase / HUMPS family protein [Actinomycetota bacterium]
MQPIVQVSLVLPTIKDAMPVAETAVRAGVDWLEVGTPLILGEGLHAVAALRKAFPDHPIVADLKTMDAGYLEAEMMFGAGATHVVVMGVAHRGTIAGAVRAAKEYGGYVMGDVMVHPDKPACARMMQDLGVHYVIVHTGLDERNTEIGKHPFDDLEAVVAAVDIPVQAVGGLTVEQAIECPKRGASLVVIGAPLVVGNEEFKPSQTDTRLYDLLHRIVTEVKSGS